MLTRERLLASLAAGVLLLWGAGAAASRATAAPSPRIPSSFQGAVTVYSAGWCGACKKLQRDLRDRDIPFDLIDIERNPSAHERAKQATGTSAIPVTSVDRGMNDVVWVVGANVGAVERAYRGR